MEEHLAPSSILLAAGGTGGHIFPAQALAHLLVKRHHPVTVITDVRGSSFHHMPKDVKIHTLNLPHYAQGISLLKKIILGFYIIKKTIETIFWMWKKKPNLIVGFGGYPVFPTLIAAILTRTPFILHEQNAYIGRVNRWFAPFAIKISSNFPSLAGLKKNLTSKIAITGNPVRNAIKKIAGSPYPPLSKSGPIHLFIVGGSQGAKSFSTLIPDTLALLPEALKKRLHIVQQTRPELVESTKKTYVALGIRAEIHSFFQNIEDYFKIAQLIICRAGASTVTELMVIGRPAIFIPFPHAMDDHQTFNAQVVVDQGGGWMFKEKDLSAALLKTTLENLFSSPKVLEKAAQNIHSLSKVNADELLADLVDSHS